MASLGEWRAKVEKELAGKPFEKALVAETPEGVSIQPLYLELPRTLPVRDVAAEPFRICIRSRDLSELDDGADALWLPFDAKLLSRPEFFIFETDRAIDAPHAALAIESLDAKFVREHPQAANTVMISTLRFHELGADGADELACVLARAHELFRAGELTPQQIARQIWIQISVGRDTFLELCKLRALRTVWRKLLALVGAPDAPHALVHAVCSSRTLTERDPWVNILRVTTQMFAAILGGADLVTPNEFDRALGEPSAQARRIARNTGLVLREESQLGKVLDPAGGSYAFETLTDQLARNAWMRFQQGVDPSRFEAKWSERLASIAKRKIPILGVSEFANLDEKLPQPPFHPLTTHRDSEVFEALRSKAEAAKKEAVLVTIGPFAESRPRAGFAANFFAAGGIRTRETTANEKAAIACVCGSDERYSSEAINRVKALKAAGCDRVLVAGRPGALEKDLREAGADGFLFIGCDVVAILSGLLS